MSNLSEVNSSVVGYIKIFFRRKELIIIPAFIGLVFGICSGIILPKKYKSETIIIVHEGKTDNPLFNKLAISTSIEERLEGIREAILGWNSLVELINRLDLDRHVTSKGEFEGLIKGLRRNLKIMLKGSNILNLTYVGKNPEETQSVLQTITDIFITRNIEFQNKETLDAIKFIEEQLKVYLGKIKSAEIAQLQDQMDNLLIDSTEKHPLVKEYKELITVKKEALKEMNLEYSETLDLENTNNTPIIYEIKRALDTLETQAMPMNNAPESQLMFNTTIGSVMARDFGVNEQIYNTLLQRIETAKITHRLQASKEGAHYEIIDPPRIPLAPFKPNKTLIAIMGLFFGLALGVGLILASEIFDQSFIDVEEAKEFLGAALFGAISKINTPESIRKEKEMNRWMYSLTLVTGVILIILTYSIKNIIR